MHINKVRISAGIEYVAGHLRYGHYEAFVDKKDIEGKSPEELKEYIQDVGTIVIDDYEIDDMGDVEEVVVTPFKEKANV